MINTELAIKLFGLDANCGKLVNPMTIAEFEKIFNIKLNWKTSRSNEYGTQDVIAINEDERLYISIELDANEIVTHINDYDEL